MNQKEALDEVREQVATNTETIQQIVDRMVALVDILEKHIENNLEAITNNQEDEK